MITDKQLREAAGEAEEYLLSHLPEPAESHPFSPGFERKMKRLMARAEHPVRYRAMRYAAAALLVVVTVFGGVLAVSPEVRASVIEWTKRTFAGHLHYFYTGETKPIMADYELTVLPEGSQLLEIVQHEDGKTYLYLHDDGTLSEFRYVYATNSNHFSVDIEGFEQHDATVNELHADIYISEETNESRIVWLDDGIIFTIFANTDKAELIELAESVKIIDKNRN